MNGTWQFKTWIGREKRNKSKKLNYSAYKLDRKLRERKAEKRGEMAGEQEKKIRKHGRRLIKRKKLQVTGRPEDI